MRWRDGKVVGRERTCSRQQQWNMQQARSKRKYSVSEEQREQFWLRQRGQGGGAMTAKAEAKAGKAT